jgi:hypothetical protein
MSETIKKPMPAWVQRIDRVVQSQLFLGALVALLTVANAFVTYRSAKASLDSSTLDFYAAREMHRASIVHLSGNARYAIDMAAYNGYRLLRERDPELAAESLSRGSEELMAGLERTGGPFDEQYIDARYGEGRTALQEAQVLYEEADRASMRSERFSLSSTILAIGLGATAWAGLLSEQHALRFVFALTAIVSLVAGLLVGFTFVAR